MFVELKQRQLNSVSVTLIQHGILGPRGRRGHRRF